MKNLLIASISVFALGFATHAMAGGGNNGNKENAGYGNWTASQNSANPGGNAWGRTATGSGNFIGSHAEDASDPHGRTSDIGEGRERADEANPNGDGCHCD